MSFGRGIEEFRAKLTESCLDTDGQGEIVSDAVKNIEDLITLTPPEFYKDTVADAHERADNELINLLESVREHELTSVQRVEQSAEALISELKNCIKKTSTNHTDINNYEKNSYYTDPDIYRLSYLSEAIYKQHEDNKDVYDFKNKLDEIGVSQELYSIMTGGLPNERVCIVQEEMWQVYYSERGKKVGQKFFETEEEACEYFYEKMKRYSTI